MSSVAVIDYGMGNLHSIAKALQHADSRAKVTLASDSASILKADRVVFPGVGAMRDCMQALTATGLADTIIEAATSKPFLGICLGMQALLSDSEENQHTDCLDLIPGHVVRFPQNLTDTAGNTLKIPHMGWNQVKQVKHPLWRHIPDNSRFYFVHSYYAVPDNPAHVFGRSEYPEPFVCAIGKDNLFAVQFHPEKSQKLGLQLLENFLNWDGSL